VSTGGAAVLIDGSWGVWPLQKRQGTAFPDTILVGRATTNDVCIVDPGISKLHARIRIAGDELWISDAASSNGTVVNGDGVGQQEIALADGDLVRFGSRVFQLFAPAHLTAVLQQLQAG
jgi:pSer/pThr/pTyr-binding forkhead associated (FHA) protein